MKRFATLVALPVLLSAPLALADGPVVRLVDFESAVHPISALRVSLTIDDAEKAGDDLVLKRMKRRHSRAQAVALCEAVRRLRPDVVFGADLIAGFPTETPAMFANTESLIEDCGLTYLHVFPYSARPGTPAARMPQVPGPERKARAAALRARGQAALRRFLASRVGARAEVLIEEPGLGRCERFAPVALDFGRPGEIVTARIARAGAARLQGVRAA